MTEHSEGAAARQPMPRWKIVLIIAAGALLVLGLVLTLLGGTSASHQQLNTPSGAGAALVGEDPNAAPGQAAGSPWGPGFLRMGLSFFVGFAAGAVLRAFLRLSLLFIGVMVLINVGLTHLGVITVHWDQCERLWSDFVARVETDFADVRTLLTGSLPQAGLGAMGLFAGLNRGH